MKAVAVVVVLIAAFFVLMGVLGIFAGIAPLFPTTEEAYLKVGVEIKGFLLVIVGAIFVAAGYFLTRFAGGISR
ncbi:MAG: hypothetical protein WB297_09910 [Actinomycetota bacterium]